MVPSNTPRDVADTRDGDAGLRDEDDHARRYRIEPADHAPGNARVTAGRADGPR